MSQEKLNIHEAPVCDRGRLLSHEADFTPPALIRQILRVLDEEHNRLPLTHLDPCAGAGVFSKVVRDTYYDCRTEAIEVRKEEEEHLFQNAHLFAIGDCVEMMTPPAAPFLTSHGKFDLIATNPAFSLIPLLVPLCMEWLSADGMLVLLGLNELGQRGQSTRHIWQRFPPAYQYRIPGTVKFRTGLNPNTGKPYTTDIRSYSWWVWDKNQVPGHWWKARTLDLLPASDRQWKIRPGTEWSVGQ